MNELAFQNQIRRMLVFGCGLWTFNNPEPKQAGEASPGRPDIFCLNEKVLVECKMFNHPSDPEVWGSASYSFLSLKPKQYRWLAAATADRFDCYVAIGTRHGRVNSTQYPRMAFFVPWRDYLRTWKEVRKHGTNSLPLEITDDWHGRLSLRDNGIYATNMWAGYALRYQDKDWIAPHHCLPCREFDWDQLWARATEETEKAYATD